MWRLIQNQSRGRCEVLLAPHFGSLFVQRQLFGDGCGTSVCCSKIPEPLIGGLRYCEADVLK